MSIELDIQTLLAPLATGRCYPMTAPDPIVKPYIIYQVISDVPVNCMDGFAGLSNKRVQIDAYATSYGGVKTLSESIKTTMAGAAFTNTHLSSQDLHESETQLYRITMDFSVWA